MLEFMLGWVVLGFFASLWHIDLVNESYGKQIPDVKFLFFSSLFVVLVFPMVFVTVLLYGKPSDV